MSALDYIYTTNAPEPVGTYSQAVKSGNHVFISGQIAIDPSTNELVTDSFDTEARRVLDNLKAVVEAAGASLKDVVKVSIFLTDMDRFGELNAVYSDYFESPFPARAVVQVARLPKDVSIEMDAIVAVS